MGILTRKQGGDFVINSDRWSNDALNVRAPKMRPSDSFAVWTGESWSAVMTDAKTFETLDDADEYVKVNFSNLAGRPAATKPSIIQPVESVTPSPAATEL
jgi:hypothetical protein